MTADFQWSFRGLTIGDETAYDVTVVDGLQDFTVRATDDTTASRWGALVGGDMVQPKSWFMEAEIVSTPNALGLFEAAFAPAPQHTPAELYPFTWKYPDQEERWMMARCRRRSTPMTVPAALGLVRVVVELWAPDPRAYSAVLHQEAISPFGDDSLGIDMDVGSGARLGINLTVGTGARLGVDMTGTVGSGTVMVLNAGSTDTWPAVTFSAPAGMSRWRLSNLSTGGEAVFVFPVGAGQQLVVDFGAAATPVGGDVVVVEGAARYAAWQHPRVPLRLAPGINELRFDVLDGNGAGALALPAWRDAWS